MNTPTNDKQHPIEGHAALSSVVIELVAQSRHQLYILADDLDPRIYSNEDFSQQLSALARRSKRPDIRILLHQTNRLQTQQHRALSLIQRLSSLIEVRQLHEQYMSQWQSYCINDQPTMIYQTTYERYDAVVINEPNRIIKEREQFEQMWQQSSIATQLRRQFI